MLYGAFSLQEPQFNFLGAPTCRGRDEAIATLWEQPWGVAGLDAIEDRVATMPDGSWLAWSGRLRGTHSTAGTGFSARSMLDSLTSLGLEGLNGVDGGFAIAWFNATRGQLVLARDRFGIEPLHYAHDGGTAVFSSLSTGVAEMLSGPRSIDPRGLQDYLLYGFCPGEHCLFRGVRRVLPGTGIALRFRNRRVAVQVKRWHRLSYRDQPLARDDDIAAAFSSALDRSVQRQVADGGRPAIMLSGGMDSSAVAAITRRHHRGELCAHSFRCEAQGFDESVYASSLAAELGMRHQLIEFKPEDAMTFLDGIQSMDCPFSDAGIEIGSWLVAKSAAANADYVLTGDGGDELWASHPVYAAHRVMQWYDKMPVGKGTRRAIRSTLNRVPDSNRKLDFRVIAKRLLPDPEFPTWLRHIRWKVHYNPAELRTLLNGALLQDQTTDAMFESMLHAFEGFDGPRNSLDAMLYSDYYTATAFYMNRLLLMRRLGVEVRLPFFDSELVDLGTRIPFWKKLERAQRTKRLFRQAMSGVVPDAILARKSKLGHSVPIKNWLREHGSLLPHVSGVLVEELAQRRGLVDRSAIERMLAQHAAGRENHSHRLWALYVLEIWLQKHIDRPDIRRPELSDSLLRGEMT